jgi:hypothetical protein
MISEHLAGPDGLDIGVSLSVDDHCAIEATAADGSVELEFNRGVLTMTLTHAAVDRVIQALTAARSKPGP